MEARMEARMEAHMEGHLCIVISIVLGIVISSGTFAGSALPFLVMGKQVQRIQVQRAENSSQCRQEVSDSSQ
jgi:NhaP-type Na+/H+ or K+/H+ antiporter